MMKRLLCILGILAFCLFGLAACAEPFREEAHTHDWDDGVMMIQPACTTKGSWVRTCRTCKESVTIELPATGHTFDETWCLDDDSHWHVCRSCGIICDSAPHTFSDGVCILCGTIRKDDPDEHIHDWQIETQTSATCNRDGTIVYRCALCGETKTEILPALGHTPDDIWHSDDTRHWHLCLRCNEETDAETHLFQGGLLCLICGTERDDPGDIGHTHDWDEGIITHAPTCTQTGTRVLTCRSCGITMTQEIPALQHDFATAYSYNNTSHWHVCTNGCGTSDTPEAHGWQEIDRIPPTCSSEGTAFYRCSVCDADKTERLPVSEHTAGIWEYNDSVHWNQCTACGTTIESGAHHWSESTSADGVTNKLCTVCGYSVQETGGLLFSYQISDEGEGYLVSGFDGEIPETVIIPATYEGLPVISIANTVFRDSTTLRHIVLGDNIRSLPSAPFLNCTRLTSITFGASVPSSAILAEDYRTCPALSKLSVSENNPFLYSENNCVLSRDGTVLLGGETTRIPDGATQIAAHAFQGRDCLTEIVLPDSVTSLGACAFYECGALTRVETGTGIVSLPECVFAQCASLQNVLFRGTIGKIGVQAFLDCVALQTLTLTDISIIEDSAFSGCYELRSIIVGDTLQTVLQNAFWDCGNLEAVYYLGGEDDWFELENNNDLSDLLFSTIYFYSEDEPSYGGNFWHYEDGKPQPW